MTQEEWFDAICKLVEDKELRIKMGLQGRETVLEEYSVEFNKIKYMDIFNDAKPD